MVATANPRRASAMALAFRDYNSIDSTMLKAKKLLGEISSTESLIKSEFKITGIINMWGSLRDTSLITKNQAIQMPMIIFHGTKDLQMTFNSKFKNEMISYGAYSVAHCYKNSGACCRLNTKTGAIHGEGFSLEDRANEISCFFKTVFCKTCIYSEKENTEKRQ